MGIAQKTVRYRDRLALVLEYEGIERFFLSGERSQDQGFVAHRIRRFDSHALPIG